MYLTYIIIGISLVIFITIIIIGAKAVGRGIHAKRNTSINDETENIQDSEELEQNSKIVSEELKKLKQLHDDGVLDEQEFKKAKDKLLN